MLLLLLGDYRRKQKPIALLQQQTSRPLKRRLFFSRRPLRSVRRGSPRRPILHSSLFILYFWEIPL